MTKVIEAASSEDYRRLAKQRLPRQIFDYLDGGSYQERTRFGNQQALAAIKLRQRVLRDVSNIQLNTRLQGLSQAMPVALGPIGLAGLMARRGEVQAQKAAVRQGISFCASTVSLCGIEEVAQAEPKRPPWFQLYVMKDRDYVLRLMQRAKDAGVSTLVVTADLAVLGSRYRDIRNGFSGPQSVRKRWARFKDLLSHPRWVYDVAVKGKPLVFGNLNEAVPDARSLPQFKQWVDAQFDPSVGWADINWLRHNWHGQLLVKGILDTEDAEQAIRAGADGVIVSNHGGRQLDGVSPTINKLREIRLHLDQSLPSAEFELWFDGGIENGLDVIKALALGADGCLLGRAWAFALAAEGQAGINNLLQRMQEEMRVAMALMGETDIKGLGTHNIEQQ
ncbi:L-lactate dehydrogenase [Idiomarina seosinensis]|uniref:L-lactate dehydrogenase n=1 Tax=Idiomarina seosinensis TaxID=281739 RepID=UPI00384B80E9